MDRLASVQFFGESSDRCSRCGMKQHAQNTCCHDEVKVIKLEQDQIKVSVPDYSIPSLTETVITPSVFIAAPFYNTIESPVCSTHSPPLLSEQDTYLQISVFRI
jgi:hypothetical protein